MVGGGGGGGVKGDVLGVLFSQNQQTRELISAGKTSHKPSNSTWYGGGGGGGGVEGDGKVGKGEGGGVEYVLTNQQTRELISAGKTSHKSRNNTLYLCVHFNMVMLEPFLTSTLRVGFLLNC